MSEDVILNAGTIVKFDQAGDGTMVELYGVTSFGAVGATAEPKEKTTLRDKTKKYGSGLKDAPDKAIKGQYIPKPDVSDTELTTHYTVQQAFFAKCRALEEFNVEIEFSDGETATFPFKALGFELDDAKGEDWKMFTCNGKQNGDPVWAQATGG